MALCYTTAKWVKLTWCISWNQNTNLIEDRSFDFISVCFLICSLFFDLFDVALVNSFILYKKLENKDLTPKEFKIRIALKLIASFVGRKLSCPKHRLSKRIKAQKPGPIPPSHFSISWKQDDDVLYAPKQEKRTEHLLRVHYMM